MTRGSGPLRRRGAAHRTSPASVMPAVGSLGSGWAAPAAAGILLDPAVRRGAGLPVRLPSAGHE